MIDAILYHATPVAFDVTKAHPLSQIGTFRAAWMRVGEVLYKRGWQFYPDLHHTERKNEMTAFIYPVRLAISRPCVIGDANDVYHTPIEIGDMLRRKRIISKQELLSLQCDDARPPLISLLKSKGYDGLVYENGIEDKGSKSYIILDAAQVTPAGPVQMTTLGEILSGTLTCHAPAISPPNDACDMAADEMEETGIGGPR
jgi:hypothetical protein